MNWNEYQQGALSTAIYPLERELDYTILGLLSEVGEIADWVEDSNLRNDDWRRGITSEIGDCFWYAAAIADALKLPLADVVAQTHPCPKLDSLLDGYLYLVSDSTYMAGLLKKAIRDDDGYLGEGRLKQMVKTLGRVCRLLDALCIELGTSSHAVTQGNLNKLADRKTRGVLSGSGDAR